MKMPDNTVPSWENGTLEISENSGDVQLSWSTATDEGNLAGYRIIATIFLWGRAITQELVVANPPVGVAVLWRVEAFMRRKRILWRSPTLHNPRRSGRAEMARVRHGQTLRGDDPFRCDYMDEAVDNGGIASYDIHVNGALYTTVAGTVTLTVLTGLSPATSVTVSVFARDLSDNLSEEAISPTFMTGEPTSPPGQETRLSMLSPFLQTGGPSRGECPIPMWQSPRSRSTCRTASPPPCPTRKTR